MTFDWNDAHRGAGLPEDLSEEIEEMAPPENGPTSHPLDVGAWGWLTPDPTWLSERPEPRLYLLHDAGNNAWTRGPGLLPRGKVAVLAGAGGVSKTYTLIALALSVVTQTPWLGHYPTGEKLIGRVALLLGEEDAAEVRRRMWTQARALELGGHHHGAVARILALPGAGHDELALTQSEERGQRARTETADALRAFLEAEAERNGEGWDLIVLDPLSRFAGPDVESDNSAATRLMQVLERFTSLPGNPAVLISHHVATHARGSNKPVDGAVAIRGSSAIVDGARWAATLETVTVGNTRFHRHALFQLAKSNYAAFPDRPLYLARCEDGGVRAATRAELERIEAAQREHADRRGQSRGSSVAELKALIRDVPTLAELEKIEALEEQGSGRKGVRDAIRKRRQLLEELHVSKPSPDGV